MDELEKLREPPSFLARVWFASLGLLALTYETGGRIATKLMDYGAQVEEEMKTKKRLPVDPSGSEVAEKQQAVERQIARVLDGLGLPSKSQFQNLDKQLDEINNRLGELANLAEEDEERK